MTFSVIVPTYNRISLLKLTLESLFKQDFPDYEIIVVNDGSTDGTGDFLKQLASENKIKYLDQPNSGPAMARNLGFKNARGELIAFTDDDCVVPNNWLSQYYESFNKNDVAGIGGSSETGNESNPFAEVNDMIVNCLKSAINLRDDCEVPFLTTNNTVYKKRCLEKVDGFYRKFKIGAEERDLNYRLKQAGEKLIYNSSIVVNHFHNADFRKFVRHQYDQGKGSFLFYRNAKHKFDKKPAMIPMNVYLQLLFYPFKLKPFARALLLSFLIIIAQVAVSVGYFVSAYTQKSDVASLGKNLQLL